MKCGECCSTQDCSLFLLFHQDVMRSSSILLVQLISWTDIWTQKYSIKCVLFIQQPNSHSAVFVLPLSFGKTACYLALIFRVPCCQDCDSFFYTSWLAAWWNHSFKCLPGSPGVCARTRTLIQTRRNSFLKQQMNR